MLDDGRDGVHLDHSGDYIHDSLRPHGFEGQAVRNQGKAERSAKDLCQALSLGEEISKRAIGYLNKYESKCRVRTAVWLIRSYLEVQASDIAAKAMESVKQDLHEDSGSGPAYDVRQEIDSLQKALRERIANSACAERLEKEQRARRPPLSRNSGAGFRPFAMPPEHLADAILGCDPSGALFESIKPAIMSALQQTAPIELRHGLPALWQELLPSAHLKSREEAEVIAALEDEEARGGLFRPERSKLLRGLNWAGSGDMARDTAVAVCVVLAARRGRHFASLSEAAAALSTAPHLRQVAKCRRDIGELLGAEVVGGLQLEKKVAAQANTLSAALGRANLNCERAGLERLAAAVLAFGCRQCFLADGRLPDPVTGASAVIAAEVILLEGGLVRRDLLDLAAGALNISRITLMRRVKELKDCLARTAEELPFEVGKGEQIAQHVRAILEHDGTDRKSVV